MKIELDENMRLAKLVKKDGKVISTYSYKNVQKENFTYQDFKKEIEAFNEFLEKQEDFDNIKDLLPYVNAFDFTL